MSIQVDVKSAVDICYILQALYRFYASIIVLQKYMQICLFVTSLYGLILQMMCLFLLQIFRIL